MEFLSELLQVIIIAAITTLTGFVSKWLLAKKNNEETNTENTVVSSLKAEIYGAVAKAVSYAGQTYVDALKKNSKFNLDEQVTAFNLAKDKVLALLTDNATDYMTATYGDTVDEVLRY